MGRYFKGINEYLVLIVQDYIIFILFIDYLQTVAGNFIKGEFIRPEADLIRTVKLNLKDFVHFRVN